VRCIDCDARTRRADVQARLDALNPGWTEHAADFAPDGDAELDETADFVVAPCAACGGRLKPDVVFFGESVPKPLVQHCFDLTESARALLVLGSSLHVMSGLRFVRRAHALRIPVVIVNRGTTRGDDLATVKLDAGCAETLAAWTDLVGT
ncbi:MAG: NAD-dependent deacetylase, partial [Actinomycetales bacterium]